MRPACYLPLLLLAAVAVGAERPARPDFGLVFNDDADLAFVVPDRARAEALLCANIGALADTPVRTLVFCIGMGGDLLYYDTKVASRVGWRKSPDEKPGTLMEKRMENARVCLAQGADAVRTAGEAARALGLRFIPSLRLNDAHFMANPDGHAMTSEFWFKHRHTLTIKESPLAFQPAYGNLLDFSHAEVRRLRLDTVFECLDRNRDLVDGFELDFNRFQVFFPKGQAAAGAPLMTDLVRRVRARLDELAREVKRPLSLFVRVPPSLADCTTAGLEVERWMREGLVDLVSPAQIMTLAWDMPVADLFALGKKYGVRVHPSLYPRTSWRVAFPADARYADAKIGRDATLDEIRGAAANYAAGGADGFYLFNFYNAFGSARPHDNRLYHLFRDLARPGNLAGQAKVFGITKSYYNDGPGSYAYGKQLPAKLGGDGSLAVTLPVAEAPEDSPFALRTRVLRLGFRGAGSDARVRVTLNGTAVFAGELREPSARFTKEITGAEPRQPDAAEVYLHVPLASAATVQRGDNAVVVSLAQPGAQVTDVELRYDYYHDLEKIWTRQPEPLNGDGGIPRR
ncbi:MAG: hypothetical protein LW690_03050 [Opitutaceae bacterium]|jgi:hypothetical protein|nr:hypothetical protein [Opitutaceae bacterium]